jgi:hypothetical protein
VADVPVGLSPTPPEPKRVKEKTFAGRLNRWKFIGINFPNKYVLDEIYPVQKSNSVYYFEMSQTRLDFRGLVWVSEV